jgi:hypothetical protein
MALRRGRVSERLRISAGAALALIAASGAAVALDWPISPPRLAATFGTPAAGRLVSGVCLASEDGLVRSSEKGELSFCVEEGSHPAGMPMPLGTFVVVEHGGGIAAVYAHLARGTASSYLSSVEAGAILGRSGATGWSEGSGALFEVFDRKEGSWVNPLLVLPPLADDKPPIIRSLALSRGGSIFVLGSRSTIPQGSYVVSADVADPADSPWTAGPLAPYILRLSVDGVEIARKVFDVARGRDGELAFFSREPSPASGLRTVEGRWVLGDRLLSRGRVSFDLRVEDAVGNKRSSTWTISVE